MKVTALRERLVLLAYRHSGFSVASSVRIEADDRAGLERLLRYCARLSGAVPGKRARPISQRCVGLGRLHAPLAQQH